MCPHLEIVFPEVIQLKWGCWRGGGIIQSGGCPFQKGGFGYRHTDTQRMHVKTHRNKRAIYTPRREEWGRVSLTALRRNPHSPQTPPSLTSSLLGCGTINACSSRHPVCATLLHQPRKLTQGPSIRRMLSGKRKSP